MTHTHPGSRQKGGVRFLGVHTALLTPAYWFNGLPTPSSSLRK